MRNGLGLSLLAPVGLLTLTFFLTRAPIPAQTPSNNRHPSVSSDGQSILFDSDRAGNSDIYAMDADGSNVKQITRDPAADTAPIGSPDGSVILFSSNRGGNFPAPYRMRPDGSNVEKLEHPERIHWSWSPDGKRVATSERGNLYIMNPDGTGRSQLTFSGSDSNQRFSPDGSRIVYESSLSKGATSYKAAIYVMNVDGSNKGRLAEGTDPSFSPDGSLVLFKVPNGADWYDIHVIGSDGNGDRTLTEGAIPRWFPDGRRIAYFTPIDGKDQIFVMDLVDGTRTQLTR